MIVILLWREHSFENRIDMLCAEIGDLKSRFDPMAAETTDCVVTEDHSGEH